MTAERTVPAPEQPWNLDRGRRAGEMGYLPGLDGIRALAVIGVMLYHGSFTWMSGGYLGVDVFFVLSGFLITTLILEEFDRRGTVSFKRFYIRRARRLLPALFLMLLVVALLAGFIYTDAASKVRADGIASIFYVANWWFIFADQSYFEFIGRPPLLKHLWSLSIEEQFYLIWPAIVFMLMKWRGRSMVLVIALVLAITSTAWMLALSVANGYPELADPSRAYFGTDTHIMGLLVGAALAVVWRPGRLPSKLQPGARGLLTGIGIASLLITVFFFLQVGEFSPWMYRGGFLVLAIVVAVLIAMATHPALPFGAWLGTQPWRYIGQRSYGLYLWHWPIFMMLRPNLDVPLDGIANFLLRIGLTFAAAELSYRYVELPIRRGALGDFYHRWKEAVGNVKRRMTVQAATTMGVLLVSVGLAAGLLAAAPDASKFDALPADVAAALGIDDGGPTEVTIDSNEPTDGKKERDNGQMSAIGDSVLLGAREVVQKFIPDSKIDADVARFPGAVLGRLRTLTRKDRLADIVVIHTGTNGVIPEDMMRDMLKEVEDYPKVIVVNVNVPRPWEGPNNKVIKKVVAEFPNAEIADWKSASENNPEYFVSDGVHLTQAGQRAFAKLIKEATGL